MAQYTGLIHGIAAWFDINLGGYILSTSPHAEGTHWHQVRLLLKEPLAVNAFETVRGWMYMTVNGMRSYDITAEIVTGNGILGPPTMDFSTIIDNRPMTDGFTRRRGNWALHEQTYYFNQYPSDKLENPEGAGLYEAEFHAMQTAELPDTDEFFSEALQ